MTDLSLGGRARRGGLFAHCMVLRIAFVLGLAGGAGACSDLSPLDAGRCGNGVIEPERGEDCDGFSNGSATCRAPGSVGECRLDCASAGAVCPVGMGCGQDALCRAPSGRFENWGPEVDGAVLRVLTADFDGDGRRDLLGVGTAGLSVSYFDPTGLSVKTERIPSSPMLPAVGDLTADGIDDIVQPLAAGLGVLQGVAGRSLSPLAYSNDAPGGAVLVPIDADTGADEPGDEMLVLFGKTAMLARGRHPATKFSVLSHDTKDLAPRVAVGRFDTGIPCQDLAFTWQKGTSIELMVPCKAGGKVEASSGHSIALPKGSLVDEAGGVVAMKVDPDEHLDLVAWTSRGGAPALAVAYGKGDGTFASAPTGGIPDLASTYEELGEVRPLAVGHLNDDFILDYVDVNGIHLSGLSAQGGVIYETVAASPIGEVWDQALLVDVNGNGLLDVVAASSASAGIDFYNGAGGGLFGYAKVPTAGAPKHLAVGDFDGDLLTDLAIAQQESDAAGGDGLAVLFGQPAGPPAAPISFGRLGAIAQIVPANSPQAGQTTIDAMTDLMVISYADAQAQTSRLSVFAGLASRLLESPFYVFTEPEKLGATRHVASPRHVVLGQFTGDDAHLDATVAAVDRDGGYGLWLLPSTGGGSLFSQPDRQPLPPGLDKLENVQLVPIDLGPSSGLQSLVLLTPWKGGDDPAQPNAVTVARVSSDGKQQWAYGIPKPIGEDVARGGGFLGQALPCDVDGDGLVDVIAAGLDGAGSAVVLWNDGTGDLDVDKRTVVPNPDLAAMSPGGDGPVNSVACLRADRDSAGELAMVLSRAVYLIKLDASSRRLLSAVKLLDEKGEPLEGGLNCSSGDFDGDGLDDLAIADAAAVHVYRARAEVP